MYPCVHVCVQWRRPSRSRLGTLSHCGHGWTWARRRSSSTTLSTTRYCCNIVTSWATTHLLYHLSLSINHYIVLRLNSARLRCCEIVAPDIIGLCVCIFFMYWRRPLPRKITCVASPTWRGTWWHPRRSAVSRLAVPWPTSRSVIPKVSHSNHHPSVILQQNSPRTSC